MQPEEVKTLIEHGLIGCKAYVEGDGSHFTAIVISTNFANKSRIQKQQLVYDTVRKYLLDGSLHALSVKTYTPDEWQDECRGDQRSPSSHENENEKNAWKN